MANKNYVYLYDKYTVTTAGTYWTPKSVTTSSVSIEMKKFLLGNLTKHPAPPQTMKHMWKNRS